MHLLSIAYNKMLRYVVCGFVSIILGTVARPMDFVFDIAAFAKKLYTFVDDILFTIGLRTVFMF